MSDKTEKKYMKKSEIVTFGIGLFGVALMTGWMPDYTATFFADFAFKGKGFDSATMANAISMVFLVAGIIGAVCELVIGYLVDNTRTKLGKVKPWVGFGVVPLAVVAMLVFIAPNTSNQTLAIVCDLLLIYRLQLCGRKPVQLLRLPVFAQSGRALHRHFHRFVPAQRGPVRRYGSRDGGGLGDEGLNGQAAI